MKALMEESWNGSGNNISILYDMIISIDRVSGWQPGLWYHCPVGVKLDHFSTFLTTCSLHHKENLNQNDSKEIIEEEIEGSDESLEDEETTKLLCNGREKFCNLTVDTFLWPATHNSGTGQLVH